jgi:hypothetical protein
MLDVNCPWSMQEALEMAEKLRPFGLRWLEEPVWPPEDYAALAQVRAEGGIAVAAGENAATLTQFQHLVDARAVDYLQPSPAKMGGISELRKVFALAARHNVAVAPHSFYDGPAFLGSACTSMRRWAGIRWSSGASSTSSRACAVMRQCRKAARSRCRRDRARLDPDPEVIRRYRAK